MTDFLHFDPLIWVCYGGPDIGLTSNFVFILKQEKVKMANFRVHLPRLCQSNPESDSRKCTSLDCNCPPFCCGKSNKQAAYTICWLQLTIRQEYQINKARAWSWFQLYSRGRFVTWSRIRTHVITWILTMSVDLLVKASCKSNFKWP